ncbi:MAG: DUF1801 domain-containing protein [Erythrobacter sp.]|nr:MAG: DUF1801 domain-containing protein [Erythrobacter sp.]
MAGAGSIDAFLVALAPAQRATVDRLRALVKASAPGLEERIKWNAPSFAKDDIDRITLGLERDGCIRVVIHRGAKAKDVAGFAFEAPSDLVRWAALDRGVMRFASVAEVASRENEISDLVRRWMEID